ncbi:cytochrome c family protein [bacterium]|nr:cytochrome c family protein [bacterium]MBU1991280.1 cytochrome c family protein [bacterium]
MKKSLYYVLALFFLLFLTACNSGSSENSSVSADSVLDENLSDGNISFANAIVHNPSFTSDHFSGSQKCAQCHDGISDSTGKDVSIVKAWESSMMANSSIDPLWRAKVASEIKRNPEYKEEIEKKCSRCHTPMATVEAGFLNEKVSLFQDGFFSPQNHYYDAAMNGVSCTLCHQIENDSSLGTKDGFSGSFIIAENLSSARKAYGPYTSPKTGPMQNIVEFTPQYSSHMNESKVCSTCHNLDTPVINTQGELSGLTFAEQSVYTEWEYSDFNTTQSCQDCHMPKTQGSVKISTQGGNLVQRSPFYQHQFLGANTYMLEIIKNNRKTLGAIADTASFDNAITSSRDFLLASADVNITDINFENGRLDFSVTLKNHSGHKFPTSYPSRRAWLHIKVFNSSNQVVFESGAMNSNGEIIGVDDSSGNQFEPHYLSITDSAQVQVYETVMADTDNNLTYTLMHASKYLKDNRILPNGFDKDTVPNSVKPYGEAANDNDFSGGSDTTLYKVEGLTSGSYSITATLNYQTMSHGFAKDLFKDTDLSEVALMKLLDKNTNNKYETISSYARSITIP